MTDANESWGENSLYMKKCPRCSKKYIVFFLPRNFFFYPNVVKTEYFVFWKKEKIYY